MTTVTARTNPSLVTVKSTAWALLGTVVAAGESVPPAP